MGLLDDGLARTGGGSVDHRRLQEVRQKRRGGAANAGGRSALDAVAGDHRRGVSLGASSKLDRVGGDEKVESLRRLGEDAGGGKRFGGKGSPSPARSFPGRHRVTTTCCGRRENFPVPLAKSGSTG